MNEMLEDGPHTDQAGDLLPVQRLHSPFERSSMVKRAGSSSLRACPVDFCPSAKLAFTESTRISGYLAERTVLLTPPIRRGPELATFGLQEVRKQERNW